jgi:hypothetical protein
MAWNMLSLFNRSIYIYISDIAVSMSGIHFEKIKQMKGRYGTQDLPEG